CLEYLNFFAFFVRGDGGPFLTLGEGGLEAWLEHGVIEKIEGDLPGRTAYPPRFLGANEHGYFRLSTFVLYDNEAFASDWVVHPTGMIEMLDDQRMFALKGTAALYTSISRTHFIAAPAPERHDAPGIFAMPEADSGDGSHIR